jgi:hypothetical protein
MTTSNQLPIPSENPDTGMLNLNDPGTGKPISVADLRAEFERLSHQVPRDPEAERAFIESKIEMIHNDPHLSEPEQQRAIEELGFSVK